MITPSYVRTMARCIAWQNGSFYAGAGGLDQAVRDLVCGAFFGPIHRSKRKA